MTKFNTVTRWPYVHICLLDLDCWCEWHLYGAPLRIHHKKEFWTIPGPLRWMSDRKSRKIWSGSSVGVTGPRIVSDPSPSNE